MSGGFACRGIRGATTVAGGDVDGAVAELLDELERQNGFDLDDVASAVFTVTDDLAGTNPAASARAHGWDGVPLLAVREHSGSADVPSCIRVLLLWNTDRPQSAIRHVYLRGARALRPDLEPDPQATFR